GCPSQLELSSNVTRQAALAQVVPRRAGVIGGQQTLVVPLDGCAHRLDQLLAALPILALPAGRVVQRDAGLRGQLLDGTDAVDVFHLLDERERGACRAAAEALVATGLLADIERRAALGVERAQ